MLSMLFFDGDLFTVHDHGGHAFIKINNNYYDSEAPNGVSDWRHLPFFKKKDDYIADNDAITQSYTEFKKYWTREGQRGWDGQKIKQFIKLCKEELNLNERIGNHI
ncbi:MAG: hypothetical protein Q8O87_02435 [bacterium]|nr:hypothetical protein [bacterium]